MNNIQIWQKEESQINKELAKRLQDLTPEILFQTNYKVGKKICLACCKHLATSVLWNSISNKPTVPLCHHCSSKWNVVGYNILKSITPSKMICNLIVYKLFHLWDKPTLKDIFNDLKELMRWSSKMTKLLKKMKE